jgi:hypothetical protein
MKPKNAALVFEMLRDNGCGTSGGCHSLVVHDLTMLWLREAWLDILPAWIIG